MAGQSGVPGRGQGVPRAVRQGPQAGAMCFKVEDGRILEPTGQPGFQPAPYLSRARWVQVAVPGRIGQGELQSLTRRGCELVRAKLTKKLQHELAD